MDRRRRARLALRLIRRQGASAAGWNIVSMNAAAGLFAADVEPELMGRPPSVCRVSLHPGGLAPRVVNFAEFAHHLLTRLRHDVNVSADPDLAAQLEEVEAHPTVRELPRPALEHRSVVVPARMRHPRGELAVGVERGRRRRLDAPPARGARASICTAAHTQGGCATRAGSSQPRAGARGPIQRMRHPRGELALFTTIATFGTPVDVTVDELALETFFPANAETAARLSRLAEEAGDAA
ncbi:MAG: hypothetical protein ACRDUY_15350 [Nitriliruptorales bacterium]